MDRRFGNDVPESGWNSVVECQLPKLDVAGSTPVARSTSSTRSTTIHPRRQLSPSSASFDIVLALGILKPTSLKSDYAHK
jgi:hypothetical protein